jgi:tetratricopeptide (TPR) repeat protein
MRAAAGLWVLGVAGALLAVVLFFGQGSSDGRLFWIGIGATLAALVLVFASQLGFLPRPSPTRSGWCALGLFTAFVLWNGLTIVWSIAPDRSWSYLNRGVVYLALVVIGLFAGALVRRRPAGMTAGLLATLFFGVLGWALLGKVFPGLFPDGARVARLRNPIGYWNALALVAALALPLALWLAAGRRHPRVLRAGGVLLLYVAVIALVLTYSRAGIVVAAAGVCLWLTLYRDRFEGLAMLVAGGGPALAVAAWAFTQPGLVDHLQPATTRERAGAWFALALVLGAAAALVLSHYGARWGERFTAEERRRWSIRLGAGVAAGAAIAVIAATAAVGGPSELLDEFRGGDVAQSSGRLGELSSNNRWRWWQESWDLFREDPAGGHGAHVFEIARRPLRVGSVVTEEPHNLAVQSLAELGIVGLLLGIGAAGFALLACAEALRRLEGDELAAASALAVLLPVYLLHALADIDWDFVAASAPVLVAVGALLTVGRPPAERHGRPALAAVTCVAALAVLYSLTAPWLAQRKVEDAYAAIARADAEDAGSAAREARDLNPFSVEPLWAWALAEAIARNPAGTLRRYREATDLQPENSDTWFALGAYEFELGRYHDAYVHLDRAYGLDPYGPAGLPGGLLDQARAKVEGG